MENKEKTQKEKNKYLKVVIGLVVIVSVFFIGSLFNFENPYQTKESCSEDMEENSIAVIDYIIVSILSEAVKCELVPIQYQNQTYNLVLSDCINTE